MRPITVLLADDHGVVRQGLQSLLELEDGIEVVGEARDGREAVRLTRELRPHVVVMDIAMPQLNGLEASRQILAALPATKILVLSAHGDDVYLEQVAEIGVVGYLVKQTSADALARAIREVHQGGTFFSRSISKRLDRLQQQSPHGAKGRKRKATVKLTPRELEVLQLIAEGSANKQSAAELGISIKTVEKHRQNLMNKLDIHDTAGLTRYALDNGIIEPGVRFVIE